MNKVNWLVDEYILESRNSVGNFIQAIKDSGHGLYQAKYIPLSEEQDYGNFDITTPVVMYGTIGYITRCKTSYFPGAYGIGDNTNCNMYYPMIPKEWMLNSGHIMITLGVLKNDPLRFFDMFGDDIFIRPNSGRKTFAGFTISRANYQEELNSTMMLTSAMPETICLLSPAKKIDAEYRFVVGNGEVIDGSEYRWDRKLDIRHDWSPEAERMADKMAKHSWRPDTVFTVDVADTPDGPKIIELNGFSCAGLYACDKPLIVDRVSEIAWKEFNGLI